jgi:hypothetical protein
VQRVPFFFEPILRQRKVRLGFPSLLFGRCVHRYLLRELKCFTVRTTHEGDGRALLREKVGKDAASLGRRQRTRRLLNTALLSCDLALELSKTLFGGAYVTRRVRALFCSDLGRLHLRLAFLG